MRSNKKQQTVITSIACKLGFNICDNYIFYNFAVLNNSTGSICAMTII